MITAVWALLVNAGCVALAPGGQVREGLSQVKTYEWGENGLFRVNGDGPQTEAFTMAQGVIAMKPGPDGTPVIDFENSRLEYFLQAKPSAESAASVMKPAFEASTRQVEILSETLGELIKALVPVSLATPTPTPITGIPPPGEGGG